MLAKTLLGEPILIGRDAAGAPFALRDLCPHRGVPLSCGSFDGKEVECCYHGWRFATDGRERERWRLLTLPTNVRLDGMFPSPP